MTAWKKIASLFQKKLIQRAPRVKLSPLETCWLLYQHGNIFRKFEIHNISTSGLGIRITSPHNFEENQSYLTTLILGDKKVKAGFKVVYIRESFMGCAFDQTNPLLAADIQNYLKVQLAAHHLVPVNEKFLQASLRDKATWLTDGTSAEIYFVTDSGKISEFQVSFFGNHLKGGTHRTLEFGKVIQTEDLEPWISWEPLYNVPEQKSLPTMAKQFIQQAPDLSDTTKQLLNQALESSANYREEKTTE